VPDATRRTRDRLIDEGMRLFGAKGYAATSVSEIEAAAGLSGGSGSLYRHFPSKQALLTAGIRRDVEAGEQLAVHLSDGSGEAPESLREALVIIAVAGLRRLEAEADFNRILIRDLRAFPDLLELARTEEIARIHAAMAEWLRRHGGGTRDPEATAAAVISSISHFWLLRDVFGEHPAAVSEDRFVAALVDMLLAVLSAQDRQGNP